MRKTAYVFGLLVWMVGCGGSVGAPAPYDNGGEQAGGGASSWSPVPSSGGAAGSPTNPATPAAGAAGAQSPKDAKAPCSVNADCSPSEFCFRSGPRACAQHPDPSDGQCKGRPTPVTCSSQCSKVCGCDGGWYCNECQAQAFGFNVSPSVDACKTKEICNDGKDNDGDGLTDMADPDCKGFCESCVEVCNDGKDNDEDGRTDCSDMDCGGSCNMSVEVCNDGVDNDEDGTTDCADTECAGHAGCPSTEKCNGLDDDGNGATDEWPACVDQDPPCQPGVYQLCDCYGGVHRKCGENGDWGPCTVDRIQGVGGEDETCLQAMVTSQSQCTAPAVCDLGRCVDYSGTPYAIMDECVHHTDCLAGHICDLRECIVDPFIPICP